MYKFRLSETHARQLDQYLNSSLNEFSYLKSRSSDYGEGWRAISVDGNMVCVTDRSGIDLDTNYLNNFDAINRYEPKLADLLKTCLSNSKEAARTIVYRCLEVVKSGFNSGLNGYKKHYKRIWENNGGIRLESIEHRHSKLHYERLLAYNYYNELSPYLEQQISRQKLTQLNVLEVGPGVGNLALVFSYHQTLCPNKYYLLDLPEALPFSISHLMYQFPDTRFILPHELHQHLDHPSDEAVFIFITPQQASNLQANTIDVAVNTNSFAEMPSDTIRVYFQEFRRVLKKNNLALIVNRVEKAMNLVDQKAIDTRFASQKIYREFDNNFQINRFSEYPWLNEDETFAYHMSPFNMCRTTQNFFLKILRMYVADTSSEL